MLRAEHISRLTTLSRTPTALMRQALETSPWQFVPAAHAKLHSLASMHPSEGSREHALLLELKLTSALALGRLGLKTPALRCLRECTHPHAPTLASMLEDCPPDHVPITERRATLDANLSVLPTEVYESLHDALPAWLLAQSDVLAYRTGHGTQTLQHADGRWLLWHDDLAGAAGLQARGLADGPVYIDGFHAPRTLERIFALTRAPKHEAQTRLVLLAASAFETLTSLSLGDLRSVLQSPSVEVWHGPDCPARVQRDVARRMDCTPGIVMTTPALCDMSASQPARWTKSAISDAFTQTVAAHARLHSECVIKVTSWDAEQTPSQRAARFAHMRSGPGHACDQPMPSCPPLRVLIPTSRYTTYVQHAADDLAHALRSVGCDVAILKEPDDHSLLKSAGITRAIDVHKPDLIIFINTLRSQLPGAVPPNVPVVTWVQDARSALFHERSGRALTTMDFVVGHLHDELFEHFAFPRTRTLASPVLASTHKFFDAPVSAALHTQHQCDIAYVSHQSSTPEDFVARVLAESSTGPLSTALCAVAPMVNDAITSTTVTSTPLLALLRDLAARTLHAAHPAATRSQHAEFLHSVVHPLAELTLRQQMVTWAADLCDREGWRLHLYGRGWSHHPRFSRYAKGELAHGEDLRAAYQSARVHLHAGLGGAMHQRVMECALSGGCTLVRLRSDDIRAIEWHAQRDIARSARPNEFQPVPAQYGPFAAAPLADYWQGMMAHRLCDCLGLPQQHHLRGMQVVSNEQLQTSPLAPPAPFEAALLLGDPASSGFWSRESFDRAATHVITSPARRQCLSAWQQRITHEHYSLEHFARSVIQLVANSLQHTAQAADARVAFAQPVAACHS